MENGKLKCELQQLHVTSYSMTMHIQYMMSFAKSYACTATITGTDDVNNGCCFKHNCNKPKCKFWRIKNFLH
jgi:hypothetical protein